ncbi:MAG: SufD family Fe-S cluster assembly protein [Candidatus Peribacteria bacterium]|nr:SufD family Fe-S cluster assembly protein [Candidatus Peribacteria bacterium]
MKKDAIGSFAQVDCNGLIIDEFSVNNAIPDIKVKNTFSIVAHEASAGKINETDLFYLMSRGISREESVAMIVNGFLSSVVKELPLEYASEMNVLIGMEFEK